MDHIINDFSKECPHFLSCLLGTSFLKPWNEERASQVRVVPQIKRSVTGFISLLKHLVLFSAWQERGRKHGEALLALSPDVFLLLPLDCGTSSLQKRHEVHPAARSFAQTRLHVHEREGSAGPAFPDSSLGLPPGAGKAGAQVMSVCACGDMIYSLQRHVECHGINEGDANHHRLSNRLAAKQCFPCSGTLKFSRGNKVLQLVT